MDSVRLYANFYMVISFQSFANSNITDVWQKQFFAVPQYADDPLSSLSSSLALSPPSPQERKLCFPSPPQDRKPWKQRVFLPPARNLSLVKYYLDLSPRQARGADYLQARGDRVKGRIQLNSCMMEGRQGRKQDMIKRELGKDPFNGIVSRTR